MGNGQPGRKTTTTLGMLRPNTNFCENGSMRTTAKWAQCLTSTVLVFSLIGLVHGQGIVVVQPNPQQTFTPFYPGEQDIPIDINGDGTNDLIIRENAADLNTVQMFGVNGNQIVADGSGNAVANMNPGDVVGPASNLTINEIEFSLIAVVFDDGTPFEGGTFAYQTNGYIGFDLVSGGQNYYGWMQVANPGQDGFLGDLAIYASIPEYAYETSPNTPIEAGQISEPVSFIANFDGANELPPNRSANSGTGEFTLKSFVDGFVLTYHLELDGSFQPTGAGIFGPAAPNMGSGHLIAGLGNGVVSNLPPPVIVPVGSIPLTAGLRPPRTVLPPPDVLVYDGQINLSSNEVAELLQGHLYVNFTSSRFRQGELRGEILPAAPVQFAATVSVLSGAPRRENTDHLEASFTLTGNSLAYQVAMDTNLIQSWIGIYESLMPNRGPLILLAKLNLTFGSGITAGDSSDTPGYPGQVLYSGELTLTDEEVSLLGSGGYYLRVVMPRSRNGETGGQILPSE
jgi:hypothetical protein